MKKIATLAATGNVTLVPHSFYYGPGLAATLHFIASTPGCALRRVPGDRARGPLIADPPRFGGGFVTVPSRAGLGADPDPAILSRYPYRADAARPFYLT